MTLILPEPAKLKTEKIWKTYLTAPDEKGVAFHAQRDALRRSRIPMIQELLCDFISGRTAVGDFKGLIDSESKRHGYFGFKGVNGQMFFNMLLNTAIAANRAAELTSLLRAVLAIPASLELGASAISRLVQFAEDIGSSMTDRRASPRPGSIPYFLSYFWQIQDPAKWPVYYNSLIEALDNTAIWTPHGDPVRDYSEFYAVILLLQEFLSSLAGKPLHLWDIEHAFYYWSQRDEPAVTSVAVLPASEHDAGKKGSLQLLELSPESYIPPVVAVLPNLAADDSIAEELAAHTGRSVERLLEERVAALFRMLGYRVEPLGQGMGRVPDGIAVSLEYHYAIIFDAKVRTGEYSFGTDDRAFREYIAKYAGDLRRRGIRNLYFMIVSSAFAGDYEDVIRALKLETEVREVILAEANALLAILERRLRNPEIQLGPEGIQRLFANSGNLTRANVLALLGE